MHVRVETDCSAQVKVSGLVFGDNPGMSSNEGKSSLLRRIAFGVLLLFLIVAGLYWLELAIPKRDYFVERRGTLVTVDVAEASSDGIVQKLVHLESSTGLRVNMRVVRPQTAAGRTLPVIIVMGGEGTGKDAVDLVGEPKGVAYLALDYPYEGDQELDAFWESLTAIERLMAKSCHRDSASEQRLGHERLVRNIFLGFIKTKIFWQRLAEINF